MDDKKAIYITDDNHKFITEIAKQESRTRQAQLNVELDKLRKKYEAKNDGAN